MFDAFFAHDSPAPDAWFCVALTKDDNDSILGADVLGDEDGDVVVVLACAEWEPDRLEAEVCQAVFDDLADGSYMIAAQLVVRRHSLTIVLLDLKVSFSLKRVALPLFAPSQRH